MFCHADFNCVDVAWREEKSAYTFLCRLEPPIHRLQTAQIFLYLKGRAASWYVGTCFSTQTSLSRLAETPSVSELANGRSSHGCQA